MSSKMKRKPDIKTVQFIDKIKMILKTCKGGSGCGMNDVMKRLGSCGKMKVMPLDIETVQSTNKMWMMLKIFNREKTD